MKTGGSIDARPPLTYNVATREVSSMLSRRFDCWLLALLLTVVLQPAGCFGQGFDLSGKSIDPVRANTGKIVVLIFVRRDCPISGRYAPAIQRISAEHQSDTRFYLVFPDKADDAGDIEKYLRDYRYSIPAVRDPAHTLVKRANAHITPEAAVFGKKGELVYHGRIDDLYVAFGRARPSPTTHELEDAINAARTGHSASPAEVAGVGCYISDLE
jgi:hypothetical protein